MSDRRLWPGLLIALLLLSMMQMHPASARGGGGHGSVVGSGCRAGVATQGHGPPSSSRHSTARKGTVFLRPRHTARSYYGYPGWAWTDAPSVDAAAPQLEVTGPHVIIVGQSSPAPTDRIASAPPLDYSYVPGCRPIPNGYHCDFPQSATAPQ